MPRGETTTQAATSYWEEVALELAAGLARLATIAPAGTKWPHFTVPSTHRIYAIVRFRGRPIYAGGDSVAAARANLVPRLVDRAAGGEWP